MDKKINLGVNVDHIATLRQVRGGKTPYPNVHALSLLALDAGADSITIHLREDRRHIQLEDLKILAADPRVHLNFEMAATPEMFRLAKKYRPHWICLVPEKRKELTTEGGLDVVKLEQRLKPEIEKVQSKGIEVSLFIQADMQQVKAADRLKVDAVEFHTGHWVLAQGEKRKKMWNRLKSCAQAAHAMGMRVHAGHGLDFDSAKEIRELPHLVEVNIGHSLVCYSVEMGLTVAVQKMLNSLGR